MIRSESIEAAAKALKLKQKSDWPIDSYLPEARIAIIAFCEAEGLTVEIRISSRSLEENEQRLVGVWSDA